MNSYPKFRNQTNSKTGLQKIRKTFILCMIALMLFCASGIYAQNDSTSTTKPEVKPFQLSFLPVMGTDGNSSQNNIYHLSLNLIAGNCGGIDGIELSGFAAVTQNNVEGTQMAGFANFVKKDLQGVELAGFANSVKNKVSGAQIAGFFNYAGTLKNGIQGTGFTNVTHQNEGLQLAGFANYNQEGSGSQAAGFANISSGHLKGVQGAGCFNLNKGNLDGIQGAGFTNISVGNLNGLQISGFANINKERLKGAQIAGFFNYTSKLSGTQIGVFNITDSLENGTPVGFMSIVKNGYRAIEIAITETLNGVVSFKTGTTDLYNIFSVGVSPKDEGTLWGWGYGLGTLRPVNDYYRIAIELSSYHINEDEWFTDKLNLHNKLQIKAHRKLSNSTDAFLGFSWNVNVRDITKETKLSPAPWHLSDKTYNDKTNVRMYPGFSAGITF